MSYAVKIVDANGSLIGELMTASADDILKLIGKGFTVINIKTNQPITAEEVASVVGISESVIGA